MKMKSMVIALLALVITQSISATKFMIVNQVDTEVIEVDPVWRGNPRGWLSIAPGEQQAKEYDSGWHNLQEIRWKLSNGSCWRAYVKDIFGRGMWGRLGPIKIIIKSNGEYTINFGQEERITRTADQGNC